MKVQIKSSLRKLINEDLLNDYNNSQMSVEGFKGRVVMYISDSRIKDKDKMRMLCRLQFLHTKFKVYYYIVNCLLKFEGNGVC